MPESGRADRKTSHSGWESDAISLDSEDNKDILEDLPVEEFAARLVSIERV